MASDIDLRIAEAIEPEPTFTAHADPHRDWGSRFPSDGGAWVGWDHEDGTVSREPRPFSESWEAAGWLWRETHRRRLLIEITSAWPSHFLWIRKIVTGDAIAEVQRFDEPDKFPLALARAAAEVLCTHSPPVRRAE